ncbi:30S ribosomal protein S21 [Phycisphaerales bacterium ac7]
MAIRIKSRGGESVEQLMRRFKKLCEKEGLTKDVKKRAFYEKPSERKRRARRRAAHRPDADRTSDSVLLLLTVEPPVSAALSF